mgnify:CR=1 FL=1
MNRYELVAGAAVVVACLAVFVAFAVIIEEMPEGWVRFLALMLTVYVSLDEVSSWVGE